MINFSRNSNSPEKNELSEVMGAEISTKRIKLPRHISSWETKSHRDLVKPGKVKQPSKTCQLNDRTQATNLAVNILRYQLQDRHLKQKHFQDIQDNLEHRLKIAHAAGNSQLVNILQAEFKQLSART